MLQLIVLGLLIVIVIKLFKPDVLSSLASRKNHRLVIDSCGLIDGRILDLAESGFLVQTLVVPEFVVHELQLLADGVDAHKRERARFGLDMIKNLQALTGRVEVVIDHTAVASSLPTDDKLIYLCKQTKGQLYTTDFNLLKVAEIAGVRVLNINDVAQKLRLAALPGEKRSIKLLQRGSNPQQAVGYLEDGTMVVVEGAVKYIGKTVDIEITRSHQTASGKMLFADVVTTRQLKPVTPRPQPLKFKSRRPIPKVR